MLIGAAAPIPAVVLSNQRLHLVRTSWAIFDTEISGTPVSDSTVIATSAFAGVFLLLLGAAIFRVRGRSPS